MIFSNNIVSILGLPVFLVPVFVSIISASICRGIISFISFSNSYFLRDFLLSSFTGKSVAILFDKAVKNCFISKLLRPFFNILLLDVEFFSAYLIIDQEEADHKVIFFSKPEGFEAVTIPDVLRIKGTYYMKETKTGDFIACYPVVIDMYESTTIKSGDGKPVDIWIGNKQEAIIQMNLALKKRGKWSWHERITT